MNCNVVKILKQSPEIYCYETVISLLLPRFSGTPEKPNFLGIPTRLEIFYQNLVVPQKKPTFGHSCITRNIYQDLVAPQESPTFGHLYIEIFYHN